MDSPTTILLIDDDPQLRSVLRRALVRTGYQVLEAENGIEGLRTLALTDVQLVITDIIMPDMEGIELILKLHRTRPNLKIIAMSAGGRISPDNYLNLAKHSGATRTITKPFNLPTFLELVSEVLSLPAAPAE